MRDREKHYSHNIPAARSLRRPMTQTEALLWEALRDRRLAGLKFRRQHATGRFVVDFYCHELRLAVEVDGGIHNDPDHRRADNERQQLIEELGIHFLRFTNDEVQQNLPSVLNTIECKALDSPSPAKSGEGVGG